MIGLSEATAGLLPMLFQMLINYGNTLQYLYGTLTVYMHESRMSTCAKVPSFPSAEWETYSDTHVLTAIVCSDKVQRALDFVEAAHMAVPVIYWTAVQALETLLDPELDNIHLEDHMNELFKF